MDQGERKDALRKPRGLKSRGQLSGPKFPWAKSGGRRRKVSIRPKELAEISDRVLQTRKFQDYPGARNGLQVMHNRPVKKIGWAVDADLASIRRAGREKVDFLVVHHGIFWGSSALDRKIRVRRIREAKRLGVAIYSSHLPLDAHPEIGNSIGLVRALGLGRATRKPFGIAMGKPIGWKVALLRSGHAKRVGSFEGLGGVPIADLKLRIWKLGSRKAESGKRKSKRGLRIVDCGLRIGNFGRCERVRIIAAGPAVCRKIGVVTGGFGDLDQVKKAGLDTLVTGEADYPTEVKARELGINLILGGHAETEMCGVQALAERLRTVLEIGDREDLRRNWKTGMDSV